MNGTKKLAIGLAIMTAVTFAGGCGGGSGNGGGSSQTQTQNQANVKKAEAGKVKFTAEELKGFEAKSTTTFYSNGITAFKGDIICGNAMEKNTAAYKVSIGKVELDKKLFKDGIYVTQRKNEIAKNPAVGEDGRLYFLADELLSTADGKNVIRTGARGPAAVAENTPKDKAYLFWENGRFDEGKIENGKITNVHESFLNGYTNGGKKLGRNPMEQIYQVVCEKGKEKLKIFAVGKLKDKIGDAQYMLRAFDEDGKVLQQYGSTEEKSPAFIKKPQQFVLTSKYVIVYGNRNLFVFEKDKGKFIGKADEVELIGRGNTIEYITKLNENTLIVLYRTENKEGDNYTFKFAQIKFRG